MNRCLPLFFFLLGSSFLDAADHNLPTAIQFDSIRVIDLLPTDEFLSGWKLLESPKLYPPKELYLLVDGAAPLYHSYGFRELSHAIYRYRNDSTLEITADIYDQGTVEGGYGVYTSGHRPNEDFQKWGTEGYRSGSILIIWKNRFYISLSASEETPQSATAMETLSQKIASKIPGEDMYPKILRLLPKTDRVAHTELYVAKDYLGFTFLMNAISASYYINSITATLFVAEYPSPEAARSSFTQYSQTLQAKEEDKTLRERIFPLRYRPLGLLTAAHKNQYIISVFSQEPNITLDPLQLLLDRCAQGLPTP